jgi:hypothetical protein
MAVPISFLGLRKLGNLYLGFANFGLFPVFAVFCALKSFNSLFFSSSLAIAKSCMVLIFFFKSRRFCLIFCWRKFKRNGC